MIHGIKEWSPDEEHMLLKEKSKNKKNSANLLNGECEA
jgi:hypothetical protein